MNNLFLACLILISFVSLKYQNDQLRWSKETPVSLFRNLSKLFSSEPFILRTELVASAIRITILHGEKIVPPDRLSTQKSIPASLIKYLSTHSKVSGDTFLVTLPVARQLSNGLRKYTSDSFLLDTQAVDCLRDADCPGDFYILWRFDTARQVLARQMNGAAGYLGGGWFYRGENVWQMPMPLSPEIRSWLGKPEISSRELYAFASHCMATNNPYLRCDLSIETDFSVNLNIIKMLKHSIDVQLTSNRPELQPGLRPIQGEEVNLVSGTTLLPGWYPKLHGLLLELARSGQTTRIDGDKLLAFLQDDLIPNTDALHIDQDKLQTAYPISDMGRVPLVWKLEHTLTQGIGCHSAVPYLSIGPEDVSLRKISNDFAGGKRFVRYGNQWAEFTAQFKARYAEWQHRNLGPIQLVPQEIMGSYLERLNTFHLNPPIITAPKADTERKQAQNLIETMRLNGLPVGIVGLQQQIIEVLAENCVRLLNEYRRARILWITPQRKRGDIAKTLTRMRIPLTEQPTRTEGHVLLASPNDPLPVNTDWTLIIFIDLDTLASGDKQSRSYSVLKRLWSISTFNRPDWFRDEMRARRVLYALNLGSNDLQAFIQRCTGTYTHQEEGLLSRLASPFKRVVMGEQEETASGVPIPPPSRIAPPRPLRQVEDVYRPSFTVSVSTVTPRNRFLDQARHYANHTEPATQPVPFMQYWPTYESMTSVQRKWYFYWRSQVRRGNYLPADLSYLFVHVYEIIHLVGFNTPNAALDYLVNFWEHYRALHPKLDGYLIDWIADFLVIYRLAQQPLTWYIRALEFGGRLTEQDIAVEAWIASKQALAKIPESVLYLMSDYKPARSKFYQQNNADDALERALREGLNTIDVFLKQQEGKSLFERYRPEGTRIVRRRPFASAVYEGQREEIVIATVPRWSEAQELQMAITSILKYTENLLRRQYNFKGRLQGITLPTEWAARLDAAFPAPVSETRVASKRGVTAAIEADERTSARVDAPIIIDFSKADLLVTESNEVRDRLTVSGEEGVEIQAVPVPADSVAESSEASTDKIPFNLERPESTPAHLLTELREVAEVIRDDEIVVNLLKHLEQHNWEARSDAVQPILQGQFLNVVLDRVNEKSADLLGDWLIFQEGEDLVVAEDYRDELRYLFTCARGSPTEAEPSHISDYDDLAPEWAAFANHMQPHHWEALNALLMAEDVAARLDGIARSAYTTMDLLIDEINEFALSSIGDIVIEANDPPAIEEEDVENLHLLIDWALKHIIVQEQ